MLDKMASERDSRRNVGDPEGKYRPEFEEEVLKTAKESQFNVGVKSLSDLLPLSVKKM